MQYPIIDCLHIGLGKSLRTVLARLSTWQASKQAWFARENAEL
jgi:hypothetical protein